MRSYGSNIGLDDGFTPNRRHALFWNNDGLINWGINASLRLGTWVNVCFFSIIFDSYQWPSIFDSYQWPSTPLTSSYGHQVRQNHVIMVIIVLMFAFKTYKVKHVYGQFISSLSNTINHDISRRHPVWITLKKYTIFRLRKGFSTKLNEWVCCDIQWRPFIARFIIANIL